MTITVDGDEEGEFLTFEYETPPVLVGREKEIEQAAREMCEPER